MTTAVMGVDEIAPGKGLRKENHPEMKRGPKSEKSSRKVR